MAQPYEIVLAAQEIYWAPFGEPYPVMNTAPAGNWRLIGVAGSLNRSEDGVTLTTAQELFDVRVDGSAYPVKQGRLSEELTIAMTMYDMTLETLALVFNNNAVTTLAGPPQHKMLQLERGALVTSFAMIIKGPSPYNDALTMQFELHKVSNRGASEIAMRRTAAAGVRMEFIAQADTSKPVGQYVGNVKGQLAA
jgi:hypothetical protein